MDIPTVSLISAALLFISSLVALFVNSRTRRTDVLSRLEETISKAQERADKLYDEKVACEVASEKLRGDLAIALVKVSDLEKELASKNGYIQGITDPLIKLEEHQKKELQGGRRATDK